MEDNRKELIVNGKGEQEKGAVLSDEVVIEIIHAFRDIMIEFLRKVSDSELRKRAVLRMLRNALNVILSNCTRTRTLCRVVYGKSIFCIW